VSHLETAARWIFVSLYEVVVRKDGTMGILDGRNRAVSTVQKLKEIYLSVDIATLASMAMESALGSYGCYGILHGRGEVVNAGIGRAELGCFD
jgi:hypothetical protein